MIPVIWSRRKIAPELLNIAGKNSFDTLLTWVRFRRSNFYRITPPTMNVCTSWKRALRYAPFGCPYWECETCMFEDALCEPFHSIYPFKELILAKHVEYQ